MLQYVGSTHRTPRRRPNRLVTMTISAVLKPLTGKLVRGFESHPRRFQPAWNGINEPAFARWEESATLPSASKCPRVPVHTANRQSHARSRARPASDRVRRLPDQSRALIVDALGLPLEGSWPRRSCDLAVISPCPRFDRVPGLRHSPLLLSLPANADAAGNAPGRTLPAERPMFGPQCPPSEHPAPQRLLPQSRTVRRAKATPAQPCRP